MRTRTLVAALSIAGCTSATDPAPRSLQLEALTPTSFAATVGTEVAPPPRVRVAAPTGQPIARTLVTFTASSGGVLGNSTVLTDEAGTATVESWRLGTTAGEQTLTVRAGGETVVFTASATPGTLASLEAFGGDRQFGVVSSTLANRLQAKASDAFGNPISAIEVTFAVTAGEGTITPPTAITGSDGIATSAPWTLGPSPGLQLVTAQTPGAHVVFTAEAYLSGPQLAFVRGGNIMRFDLETGAEHRLTAIPSGSEFDQHPAWSPDGRRIAFSRYGTGSHVDVYVMDADGTNLSRQTVGYPFHSPTWSPDGASIAVAGDGGLCVYDCSIYTLRVGSEESPRRIATMGADPAWSPDGTRIAYVSLSGDDGYHALHTTSIDGTHTTVVVPRSEAGIFSPSWSPTGQHIAFTRCHLGVCDIFTVAADGSQIAQLIAPQSGFDPTWSPDGRWIAFTVWPQRTIVSIPATGGTPVPLILDGYQPAWRP